MGSRWELGRLCWSLLPLEYEWEYRLLCLSA